MTDVFRYGIVGCGGIAPWHARGVKLKEGAEIVAVCDVSMEAAQKLSNEFGGVPYDDYNKMFNEVELDGISICTPGGTHCEIVVAAANSHVNVLCEKPLEVSRERLDRMVDVCHENGVKLAGIFQLRTTPLWRAIRRVVTSGMLGKMILADAYLKYYRSSEYYQSAGWRGTYSLDGGGCLMNQGIHCVDLLLWTMGPVTKVSAFADHLIRDIEVEDTAVCLLNYANGAMGVLEGATSVYPGMKFRLEFHGECGTLRADGSKIVELRSELLNKEQAQEVIESAENFPDNSARDPLALGIEAHVEQIHDFIQAVEQDREPMVTGEEARKPVDLILSLYDAARNGCSVGVTR